MIGVEGGGTFPDASTTTKGIVELDTPTETATGTSTSLAVTPAGLKAVTDALPTGDAATQAVTADGLALTEPDGGPDCYGQFRYSMRSDPGRFPLAIYQPPSPTPATSRPSRTLAAT